VEISDGDRFRFLSRGQRPVSRRFKLRAVRFFAVSEPIRCAGNDGLLNFPAGPNRRILIRDTVRKPAHPAAVPECLVFSNTRRPPGCSPDIRVAAGADPAVRTLEWINRNYLLFRPSLRARARLLLAAPNYPLMAAFPNAIATVKLLKPFASHNPPDILDVTTACPSPDGLRRDRHETLRQRP